MKLSITFEQSNIFPDLFLYISTRQDTKQILILSVCGDGILITYADGHDSIEQTREVSVYDGYRHCIKSIKDRESK